MDYTKSNNMNGKYRETNSKSRSRFYILLSVIFVFVMFKWGVPFFIGVISGPATVRSNSTYQDNLPPQTPLVSALPEATNSAKVIVQGFTEINADTELYINDAMVDSKNTDENGAFLLEGKLVNGSNRITVTARDSAGLSSQSNVTLITFDDKPVVVKIESPKDGTEYFGTNSQSVDINGTVNKPESTVIVNNSFANVGKDGKFSQRIQLNSGENNIVISASDKAGNTKEETLKLVFTP